MDELNYSERNILQKVSIETLKEHYTKKYDVQQLNNIIKALQKMGLKNSIIAERIGIKEDSLYYITPIDNATPKTTKLIREGHIDGYKAARLLRSIGKSERQNEFIETVIKEDMSIPKAEAWISEQKNMQDPVWVEEKRKKEFEEWIIKGYSLLTKNKIEKVSPKDKERIKIIMGALNRLVGNGI
jgi:hypothetical protein